MMNGISQSEPLLLTAVQLAKLLGISRRTVFRLTSSAKLPRPIYISRLCRWSHAEIQDWIKADCPTLSEWELMRGREVRS